MDDDPVISMDCIEEVNLDENKIKINLSCDESPNKLQENAFAGVETLFSKIKNTTVRSTDGKILVLIIKIVHFFHLQSGVPKILI